MNLALYSTLTRALQPWLRRKLARRARVEPLYGQNIEQRFGRYDGRAQPVDLWLHAVSLGEARAAAILLAALRQQRPGLRVLLTHGTATGWAQGEALLSAGDQQAWLPWDSPEAVTAFLDHFQPRMGLLIETEVWPNLVLACKNRGIDLVLANGRLSEKSLRSALRLGFWARPAYQALAAVWPQTDADAKRYARLGVTRMQTLGNLKFDLQPDAQQIAHGLALKQQLHRPLLMLASSREGEEQAFIDALAQNGPTHLPCVVPRHPQRFDEVQQLIESKGWRVVRRSQITGDTPDLGALQGNKVVLLGDTMGEMAFYYALAHVALMGGSFQKFGGQNLIEALACGCPVVLGPHTYNFEQASTEALAAGAALRASDMADGVRNGLKLCAPESDRATMSQAGHTLLTAHRGVAQRMAGQVLQRLDAGLISATR
jgi:3-deoxy-D-manno-octulosonic-acid transferase